MNFLALAVFILGSFPLSALASLSSTPTCEMACCAGQPAHQPNPKEGVCAEACAKAKAAQATNSLPATEIKAKQVDNCNCSIGSAPSSPKPDAIAISTPSFGNHLVDAIAPQAPAIIASPVDGKTNPGIYGSDSGPPNSRPNYVSLGRAPPVLLA